MYGSNCFPSVRLGVFERVFGDSSARALSNQLYALNHSRSDLQNQYSNQCSNQCSNQYSNQYSNHMSLLMSSDLMFDTTVFSFSVLSDGDDIDVIVKSFVAFDGTARPHIGVKRKHSAIQIILNYLQFFNKTFEILSYFEIQRSMSFAYRCGQRSLQTDLIL